MSKNIYEIVRGVFPNMKNGDYVASEFWLAKALTEKKLCVPMSEEAIEKIIGDIHYDLLGTGTPNGKFHSKCAKAIYERQFKEVV